MNSLLFGLALVGILIILRWYVENDGQGQNDGRVGLLAMTSANADAPPAAPAPANPHRRSFRRKG